MSPIRVSRFETAIRVVIEFSEVFNRHDVDGMMKLMSDDCLLESASPSPDGFSYSGKDVVTRFWEDFFQSSPSAHMEIEEVFSLGFRCVMRWRYEWANETGENEHIRKVDIFRVRDGFLCEQFSYVKG